MRRDSFKNVSNDVYSAKGSSVSSPFLSQIDSNGNIVSGLRSTVNVFKRIFNSNGEIEFGRPKKALLSGSSKKLNLKSKGYGILVFVIIPSIFSLFYYSLFASDIYVSESKFSVDVSESGGGLPNLTGKMQMLSPIIGNNNSMTKSFMVREYIHSNEILEKLDKRIGLRGIYNNSKADYLSALGENVSQERFINYYKKMVEVRLEETSSIMYLKVRAFKAEDAKLIADTIIQLSEEFVNNVSRRMKEDTIAFSQEQLKKAEEQLILHSDSLASFRNSNRNYDPVVTTKTVIKIISGLESELTKTETQIASLESYMRNDSPQLEMLRNKQKALKAQIEEQNKRLADEKGSKLADMTQNYSSLDIQNQFAIKRYEINAASLEAAQIEARKNNVYLLRIDDPYLPQSAAEPERIKCILTVFFSLLIAYTIIRVIISSILDHIRK